MKMKILAFSLGPIFRDRVHGGSQKILKDIVGHLGEKGHCVTVLCVMRDDNKRPFTLHKNVEVRPVLRFKQFFPSSYRTPPYNLTSIIEILKKEIGQHDALYIHDGGLNLPFLTREIPTVVSLRDYIYPETLVGAFNFDRDILILNSNYMQECVLATIGQFRPNLKRRITVIRNGIDLNLFKRTDNTTKISRFVRLKKRTVAILFPHRFEPSKGIFQAIEILRRLKKRGLTRVTLIIPKHVDAKLIKKPLYWYREFNEIIQRYRLETNLCFHEYLPYKLMPSYYSLGKISLNIGSAVETFGNTLLEALACEVYPIVARVGAMREVFPDEVLPKVDFDDLEIVVEKIVNIIKGKETIDFKKIRRIIRDKYNYNDMVNKYEQVITGAKILPPLEIRSFGFNVKKARFRLAPWCYVSEKGIYNDFTAQYSAKDKFYLFIKNRRDVFSCTHACKVGISPERLKRETIDGTIVLVHN